MVSLMKKLAQLGPKRSLCNEESFICLPTQHILPKKRKKLAIVARPGVGAGLYWRGACPHRRARHRHGPRGPAPEPCEHPRRWSRGLWSTLSCGPNSASHPAKLVEIEEIKRVLAASRYVTIPNDFFKKWKKWLQSI